MATTYYSTRPPGSTGTGTNQTNVVNPPDDYYLNAGGGRIDTKSGGVTQIQAGSLVKIYAGTDVLVNAIGGNVDILSDTANINFDAGSEILAEAGTSVTIETPETYIKSNVELGNDVNSNTTDFKSKVKSDILPKSGTEGIGNDANIWNKSYFQEGEYFSGNNPGNPYFEFGPDGRPYDPLDIYDTAAHRQMASVYVNGGVGIEKDLNVGGRIYGRIEIANTSFQLVITATNADLVFRPVFVRDAGEQFIYVDNQGIDGGLTYNPYSGKLGTELLKVVNTQTATATTGSVRVEGGISVGENIVTKEVTPPEDASTATEVYGLGTTSTQWQKHMYTIFIRK